MKMDDLLGCLPFAHSPLPPSPPPVSADVSEVSCKHVIGETKERCKLAGECSRHADIFICRLLLVVLSIFMQKVYFFLAVSSSLCGCGCVNLFFSNEEEKKVGL